MLYSPKITKNHFRYSANLKLDPNTPLSLLLDASNSTLYFKYFGRIPGNFPVEDDNYDLLLGVNENDKLFKRKVKLLKKLGWNKQLVFMIKAQLFLCDIESNASRKNFEKLFAFIRICQANEGTSFD